MDELEFYTDPFGDHRWRVLSPNHEVVLASTEGYVREVDCQANARRFLTLRPAGRDGRFPVVPATAVHATCRAREVDSARVRRAARAVLAAQDHICDAPGCCQVLRDLRDALIAGGLS